MWDELFDAYDTRYHCNLHRCEVCWPDDFLSGLLKEVSITATLIGARFAGRVAVLGAVPRTQAEGCQFVLGIATLYDMIPDITGRCVDDKGHNLENGDGLRHTVTPQGGTDLLVWRNADNWTAFTDGYHTWVNGPGGLEYRLNSQRFAWKANPGGLPIVPDTYGAGPLSAAQGGQGTGAKQAVTNAAFGNNRGPLVFDGVGSRFVPGETLTIQGTYTPAFVVHGTVQRCTSLPLGPVQGIADASGNARAPLNRDTTWVKGGPTTIMATGSGGSSASLGSAGSLPQVEALPLGCRA